MPRRKQPVDPDEILEGEFHEVTAEPTTPEGGPKPDDHNPEDPTPKPTRKKRGPPDPRANLEKAWAARRAQAGTHKPPLPWHLVAIRMYARGISQKEIARRLEKLPETISLVIDRYPEEVDKAVKEISTPEDVIAPMLPKAAQVYHNILETNPDGNAATMRVQQGVASDVLDRAFGKPISRNISSEHHSISITFHDSSDDASLKNEELILAQLKGGVYADHPADA